VTGPSRPAALAVLDWRRRVHALYAAVRDTVDPVEAHEGWRAGRDELFGHHPASPIPTDQRDRFAGLRYGPYDPELRFPVEVDGDVEPRRLDIPTGTDGVVSFERIGRLHLDGLGALDAWWLQSYGNGLFVPLRDANPATYGGGRYVLDTAKGADLGGTVDRSGRPVTLDVDLNFAYNPSCAYDPAWACPLAPPENRLPVAVHGGELALA